MDAESASHTIALRVAEAQVDLQRVRRVRHDFLLALSALAAEGAADKLSTIVQAAARLEAIDRYERSARSRWRVAVRAFDAVRRTWYKNTSAATIRTRNSAGNSVRAPEPPAPLTPLRGALPDLTLGGDIRPRHQPVHIKAALLDDRGVVRVAGEDARKFLNGLLTTDIDKVRASQASYAALLTPQGKIIVDFLIAEASDGVFLLDCPRAEMPALVQRLSFYKLRAKVTVEDVSEHLAVFAVWDEVPANAGVAPVIPAKAGIQNPGTLGPRFREDDRGEIVTFPDPRLPALGFRVIAERSIRPGALLDAEQSDASAYTAHRIALGVPEGGIDFAFNDAFPHEADMDQLSGVDFKKGCFIGQEVVSRMEHRGTARTRVVPVSFAGTPPAPGTPVTAAGKPMGEIGSVAGDHALALLRLDRVSEALAEGATLEADGAVLTLRKPAWARFAFPGEGTSET